jgi:hypothetical protein
MAGFESERLYSDSSEADFDSGNTYETRETPLSSEEIRASNQMQMALIREFIKSGGFDPEINLQPHINKWIEDNAAAFRDVFNEMKAENPDILTDWQRDEDTVLAKIQTRMSQLAER